MASRGASTNGAVAPPRRDRDRDDTESVATAPSGVRPAQGRRAPPPASGKSARPANYGSYADRSETMSNASTVAPYAKQTSGLYQPQGSALQAQQSQQLRRVDVSELATEEAIQREKNEAAREIEAEAAELNGAYKEFAALIGEQQSGLDAMNKNVASATVKIEKGSAELATASTHQKSARKRMCCLVVLLAIIIAVIVVVVVVVLHH